MELPIRSMITTELNDLPKLQIIDSDSIVQGL